VLLPGNAWGRSYGRNWGWRSADRKKAPLLRNEPMDNLIKTFQEDHRHILTALENIKNIGADYSAMSNALKEIKETFLAHMSLEDSEFYLKLRRKVKLSQDLVRTLDFLVQNLEELKISSLIFFEKYNQQEIGFMEKDFAADFHHFCEKVSRRIELEEGQLFPLFGKYIKDLSAEDENR
jgi:hemerythrin-like domain-containing protein